MIEILDVFLHQVKIGILTLLPGDRNIFTFDDDFAQNPQRPTISLSFIDSFGNLIRDVKSTRTKLPSFFSNLLPEGYLREYLAQQAKVSAEREFFLLRALGEDLPGALKVYPASEENTYDHKKQKKADPITNDNKALHFSLAGIQLKFSVIWENGHRLTIPVNGVGGKWIVKLPSSIYSGVPENEYAMMQLAKQVDINVPEIALVPIEQINGIPEGFKQGGASAYVIKRFDRTEQGQNIHMEDFAQVFGVYPDKKYSAASYRNIIEVIWKETGEAGVIEFIKRFVFNALIGNGDMHLKNWSLLYPDQRKAILSPGYDFVSTIPYLPKDALALTFVDSKLFTSLTAEQFKRFANKSRIPESLLLDTMEETIRKFKIAWKSIGDFYSNYAFIKIIENHFKVIPIYNVIN